MSIWYDLGQALTSRFGPVSRPTCTFDSLSYSSQKKNLSRVTLHPVNSTTAAHPAWWIPTVSHHYCQWFESPVLDIENQTAYESRETNPKESDVNQPLFNARTTTSARSRSKRVQEEDIQPRSRTHDCRGVPVGNNINGKKMTFRTINRY